MPKFTFAGTCYNTATNIVSHFPITINSIKFWMKLEMNSTSGGHVLTYFLFWVVVVVHVYRV